jgi:cation diffusion facilitator family transporter
VASFGLFINFISAILLNDHHHHQHVDDDDHKHHHHDHNLKAAYFHVLADALTSVLAIIALTLAKYYSWQWLDPVMGIVGGIIIARWSYSIMQETSPVLLDESIDLKYKSAIKEQIESDADSRIADLHVWRVGPNHFAAIISLVSHNPKAPDYYKDLLKSFRKLAHITVEVNRCNEESCE